MKIISAACHSPGAGAAAPNAPALRGMTIADFARLKSRPLAEYIKSQIAVSSTP